MSVLCFNIELEWLQWWQGVLPGKNQF